MLAKRVGAVPEGSGWLFEPKWDGFRTLVFRDGDELLLQSRDEKPLDRYFPELHDALLAQLPPRCVLDGEIVLARGSSPWRSRPRSCSSTSCARASATCAVSRSACGARRSRRCSPRRGRRST